MIAENELKQSTTFDRTVSDMLRVIEKIEKNKRLKITETERYAEQSLVLIVNFQVIIWTSLCHSCKKHAHEMDISSAGYHDISLSF